MSIYRWKFLREGLKSQNGNLKWTIGKWNRAEGKLLMCNNGLHCSKTAYQAFSFVQGEILAKVECKGGHLIGKDKECWREQRVVKSYEWTKKDSVKLAIYSAELVIKIFEKRYPKDKRPRKAIEAAKRWLKNPTERNRHAAYAAATAVAAVAAAAAADDAATAVAAATAAYAAAYAAATDVAATAAYAAAYAAATDVAATAAAYAARKKLCVKICKYFTKLTKGLKEIK